MKNRIHIGLSLGKLSSLMDGLGEFSSQLCQHVALEAPRWRERWGVQFHVHLPAPWCGIFGDELNYIPVRSWQGRCNLQPRRFDVWHSLHQLGKILPPFGTRHRILTIHDLNPIYLHTPSEAAPAIQHLANKLKHYDQVTTLTRFVENDIREHLHWKGPVAVIPNGVRDLVSSDQDPIHALQGIPYFFHLSRMTPSKNPDKLLDLAALWPEHRFVLAGPASTDSRRMAALVHNRHLDNVTILESITDAQKAWLYGNCEAFLFPSQTEGFGLPPLEAMCFGKPVFLSTCTCLPEIGGTAAAYWDDLSAPAMLRVLQTELPRLKASHHDIRTHASNFRWSTAAAAYLDIYREQIGLT